MSMSIHIKGQTNVALNYFYVYIISHQRYKPTDIVWKAVVVVIVVYFIVVTLRTVAVNAQTIFSLLSSYTQLVKVIRNNNSLLRCIRVWCRYFYYHAGSFKYFLQVFNVFNVTWDKYQWNYPSRALNECNINITMVYSFMRLQMKCNSIWLF